MRKVWQGRRLPPKSLFNAKYTGDEASDVEPKNAYESVDNLHERITHALEEADEKAAREEDLPTTDGKTTLLQSTHNINWLLVPAFYFCLGAFLATPSLAIKYFALRVLEINPGMFGLLYGVVCLPWFLKPLFGLFSDNITIMGRHRAPYVLICALLGMVAWILLAVPGRHSRTWLGFGILMLLSNAFICMCDVCVDCILARNAREEISEGKKGRSQTTAWFMRHAGSLFGIVLGGYLVAHVRNLHIVFGVTAVFPAVLFVGSFFLSEKRDELGAALADGELFEHHHRLQGGHARGQPYFICCASSRSGANTCGLSALPYELKRAYHKVRGNQTLVNLCKFILLYSATPNSALTFSYYLINELKFSEAFMAWLSIAAVVAMIAGLGTYYLFFKNIQTRTLMRLSIVVGTLLATLPIVLVTKTNRVLGIEDEFFALGDDIAESFASQLMAMPLMIAIAASCPEGDEGLIYSGCLSLSNFGNALSTWAGALLTHVLGITKTNYANMWILVVVCTSTNIVPIFFVHLVPELDALARRKINVTTLLSETEPSHGGRIK